MGNYGIVIICLIIVALSILLIFLFRKKNNGSYKMIDSSDKNGLSTNKKRFLRRNKPAYELSVKFDELPALTEAEESRLVEVTDKKLLSRIDNAVPGTFQAMANAGAAHAYKAAAKSAGQLYQAIIPQGAVLDHSRAMEGAFRGSYRQVANSIKGNANWVPVDNTAANNLAAVGAANAVMGIASMVVGQYYMTQINNQLEGISSGIEKIADFQQNEFKSKVYALVAEVQKSSTFQVEIIEDSELRNRELQHLKSLEHECAQLLGQANLSLQDITAGKDLSYEEYEKSIGEAEIWYQYQQILLEVMYKISDLTYALNLGAISRENSYALFLPYKKQAEGTLRQLNDWHQENAENLGIDLEAGRRKKHGIENFFTWLPGQFNDDLNYKEMSERTAAMIEHQESAESVNKETDSEDLFQKDVRLIAKDGRLYYLPEIATGGIDSEIEANQEEGSE